MKRFIYILFTLAAALIWSCSRIETGPEENFSDIKAGDNVLFTSYVPEAATRSMRDDFQNGMKNSYKVVNSAYSFTVKMLKYRDGEEPEDMGSAVYAPLSDVSGTGFAGDGTLVYTNAASVLRWQDNNNRYGFEATAGSETLSPLQTEASTLLAQDLLKGYSYEPLWDGLDDNGKALDDIDAVNFRTSKEWYAATKKVYDDYGQMPLSTDDLKKIPLFFQHQRSLVTVILKADEGVSRDQLAIRNAEENISAKIFNYSPAKQDISPLLEAATIDYAGTDYGGAESGAATVQYSAIVNPYDYLSTADEKPICEIVLSGQKFSYYASNDRDYNTYRSELNSGSPQSEDAKRVANSYNLKAGQHLVLTVTLSRETRKIVITAYVEDWTDKVTTSICDDYGKNGDPEIIDSRDKLLAFLQNPSKNKSGTVAIISPTSMDLDKKDDGTSDPWPQNLRLFCTLNLAGSVMYTQERMFYDLVETANLVNGTIYLGNGATVEAGVASINKGTIERVDVVTVPKVDADGNTQTPALASRGGIVNVNHGTIYQCSSSVPVQGSADGYVGGIAAQSIQDAGTSRQPVLSKCTVTARVDGNADVTAGGGIVGNATGNVSDNTYTYGVSVLQDSRFKNIIGTADANLQSSRNSWPTTLADPAGDNANSEAKYTGVVSSQEELSHVLESLTYNVNGSKIVLADDFTVSSDTWDHGEQDATLGAENTGNVFFELYGNDKTITLTGTKQVTVDKVTYATAPMLFTNIQNTVRDLTIVLEESLIASPSYSLDKDGQPVYDGLDAIAPLAYSVYGATISNIKVKTADGKYIQAAMPGGVVAWAYGGAVIDQCEFKGDIKIWLPERVHTSSLRYAGGIAALAETATFSRCMFHTADGTLVENSPNTTTVYCGGILGGISRREHTSNVTPLVTIKDCASNFAAPASGNVKKGAIIGASFYNFDDASADGLCHAEGAKCEGNWWGVSYRAVGTTYGGMTDAKALGLRNSVDPTFKDF